MNNTSTTTSTPLVCACGTPLTGGRDTFGEPGKPAVCATCWFQGKGRQEFKRSGQNSNNSDGGDTTLDAFCAAADRALLLGDAPTVQEVGG